jgi:hypothetical protein
LLSTFATTKPGPAEAVQFDKEGDTWHAALKACFLFDAWGLSSFPKT